MTMEKIRSASTPSHRVEGGSHFVVNPTTGALEISPAYRDEAVKAVMREVRRMKLRLYLTKASLYFELFCLKGRSAVLGFRSNSAGYFQDLFGSGHRNISRLMKTIFSHREVSVKSGIIAPFYICLKKYQP